MHLEKKNKELIHRKKLFNLNFNKLKLERKHDLIFCGNVKKEAISYLQEATKTYLLSCLIGAKENYNIKNLNWKSILKQFLKNIPSNITHNGLVVPKKENSLEFNMFLKSFYFFIKSTGLQKKIAYFIVPPQLRIKMGSKKRDVKPNASEYIHSDAWTKINTKASVTLFLPIFGDFEKNYVEFFVPKINFKEEWLNQKYFVHGEQLIANHYKKIRMKYNLNKYILADCAILHRSVLKNNSGPRVSLDIGFIPNKSKNFRLHRNHVKNKIVNDIGFKKLFIYLDSFTKKIVFKKSGTNTQSNRKLINL